MPVDVESTFDTVLRNCENACMCKGEFPHDEPWVYFRGQVDDLFLSFVDQYEQIRITRIEEPQKSSETGDWYVVVVVDDDPL